MASTKSDDGSRQTGRPELFDVLLNKRREIAWKVAAVDVRRLIDKYGVPALHVRRPGDLTWTPANIWLQTHLPSTDNQE